MRQEIDAIYVKKFIENHAKYAFDEDAQKLIKSLPIIICDIEEVSFRNEGFFVFKDLVFSVNDDFEIYDCFGVDFPVPCPVLAQLPASWVRSENFPWLLLGGDNRFALDFDFWGFLDHFLINLDQKPEDVLDQHGRQLYRSNSLVQAQLHQVPVLNIALFAILSFAKGWGSVAIVENPSDHILPPLLMLSHDCDQLRGNDFYTQSVRLFRFFKGIFTLQKNCYLQLKYILLNFIRPTKYYFNDALYMRDLERNLGFKSIFYLLNGKGGRYGARSGSGLIKRFINEFDDDSEVGIHYNYDYSQNALLLNEQLEELNHLVGASFCSGRAHYLTLDFEKSFSTIQGCGIRLDESVGYATDNAFRVGFAGAYVINTSAGIAPLYELPLLFMDANVVTPEGQREMSEMLSKIERVGGVVTFLFHPGLANNPEFPEFLGIYERYLEYFSNNKYRSVKPKTLVALLDK